MSGQSGREGILSFFGGVVIDSAALGVNLWQRAKADIAADFGASWDGGRAARRAARRAAKKARARQRAWLALLRRQANAISARDATEAEALAMLASRGGGRPNPLDNRMF